MNTSTRKILLISTILLFSAAVLYFLSIRLAGQLYLHAGKNDLLEERYTEASANFEKAVNLVPSDYHAWIKLSIAYYNQAHSLKPEPAFPILEKSRHAAQQAVLHNDIEPEANFRLALAEARLQALYPAVTKDWRNPYDAGPWFEKALERFPYASPYHEWYARYLSRHFKTDRLLEIVENLVRIDPAAFSKVKREPYWSAQMARAAQAGLQKALQEPDNAVAAHRALADFYEDRKEYEKAIHHCGTAMDLDPILVRPQDHIRMGRLYLYRLQTDEAESHFFAALAASEEKEGDFNRILGEYRRTKTLDGFQGFYREAENKIYFTTTMRITAGRGLFEADKYTEAKGLLDRINREREEAEAFYWLARVAEKENKWDAMELAIQRATVLQKTNSNFHQMFANVLVRRKKFDRAEQEISLAIQHSEKPNPYFFSSRGAIRYNQKNYPAALQDYQKAIDLKPDQAPFYYMAALCFQQLYDRQAAIQHVQKAVSLAPDNKTYQKLQEQLENR